MHKLNITDEDSQTVGTMSRYGPLLSDRIRALMITPIGPDRTEQVRMDTFSNS